MTATAARELPTGAEWSYEVKWDGYRAQIVKDGPRVSLASRNLKDITDAFRRVADAARGIAATSAIVDGEIVALDAEGRPSFQALHHWATAGLAIVFYAFDLMHLDGKDLIKRPLDERRASLTRIVSNTDLLLSDPLPGAPAEITTAVRRLGLEGIVAKRKRSLYEPGRRSDAWIKVRFAKHQELVIGGYKPLPNGFDSIVVGYYQDGSLMSAGKVRNGLTPRSRALLFERLEPLIVKKCPFANLPTSRTSHWGEGITAEEMAGLVWVKPRLVVEVAFTEWTRDGSLRHAAVIGMRDDKDARAVRRESTETSSRA